MAFVRATVTLATVAATFGVAFFALPVSSPLLSLLRWLALCVLAAGLPVGQGVALGSCLVLLHV